MASKQTSQSKVLFLFSFLMLVSVVFLAACGSGAAATSNAASSMQSAHAPVQKESAAGSSQSSSSSATDTSSSADASSQSTGPAYLIKTLNVTMQVQNTRQVAATMAGWISSTDPRSTSAGAQITQGADANTYNVQLTYDVRATLYPKVYDYLRDYNLQKGVNSHLVSFNESVQNVTNDYIDTQSRIKNYKGEQTRLLTLLNQANTISNVLSIEAKLTDVEGNIESSEEHLNDLTNQVTYYTVTINLQPFPVTTAPRVTAVPGWSFGQVMSSAFGASLDFGRSLLTFMIWILAFAVYIIPALIIIFLVRRYRHRLVLLFTEANPVRTPPKSI
jgi:hypothetical protein